MRDELPAKFQGTNSTSGGEPSCFTGGGELTTDEGAGQQEAPAEQDDAGRMEATGIERLRVNDASHTLCAHSVIQNFDRTTLAIAVSRYQHTRLPPRMPEMTT